MKYDKSELLNLLDSPTIKGLCRLYGIHYKYLAFKLGYTRPNVFYKLKNDCFQPYEKEIILNIFTSYGLEAAELMLFNQMIKKAVKQL